MSRVRVVFVVVHGHFEEHVAARAPRPRVPAAGVEGEVEAFALLYYGGVPVSPVDRPGGRRVLGLGAGEEEVVGYVLAVRRALLGQVIGPAEELEHRQDELLLGDGLVGPIVAIQPRICVRSGAAEFGEGGAGRAPPVGGGYAVGEEVFGEEFARHVRSSEDGERYCSTGRAEVLECLGRVTVQT